MNDELTLNINGLDEVQSSLGEIRTQFIELKGVVEDFAEAFDMSQETANLGAFADTVNATSSAINIVNEGGKALSKSFEMFNAVLGDQANLIGASNTSLSTLAGTSAMAVKSIGGLTGTIGILSSSLAGVTAAAGLAGAAFLIFNQWDEMSDAMQVFAVALGIASVAVLAFQIAATVATPAVAAFMLPIIAIVAIIAAAVAAISLLSEAFSFFTESEEDKKIKAETDAIKDQTDAIKEQTEAYDGLKAKRQDSTYDILAQAEMNQILADEIENLSGKENKSAEEKERLKEMVGDLNNELGTNIELSEDGNSLTPESIELMGQEIEATKAKALAEVVAAELKEQYTQVLKASNQIRADQVKQEELLNGRSYESLSSNKKKEYDALEESIEASTELRDKANGQVEELEGLHNKSLTGQQEEFMEEYNKFTGMQVESAQESAFTRKEIDAMMYEGMSAQESEAYQKALEKLQTNGVDINTFLDENGKLRKDISLEALNAMNKDLEDKQIEAKDISEKGGKGVSDGYTNKYSSATEKNQPKIDGAAKQNVKTTENAYGLNKKTNKFGQMADDLTGEFNGNISDNVPATKKAMNGVTGTVTGSFDGKKLPKLKGNFKSNAISSALGKIAGLFGFEASPRLEIEKCAAGGLIEPGQFFLAREAGPELVGNIGNKTAVMNNNQIVDAVSNGVYRAVTAAMNGGDGNDNRPVNITMQVGKTQFGKVAVDSINALSRMQGGVNLAL